MFCFPSPSTCRYSIATSTHTGVCRRKSFGTAGPQHGAVGVVTSSKLLSELPLLLLSSSPSPCRGKEREGQASPGALTPRLLFKLEPQVREMSGFVGISSQALQHWCCCGPHVHMCAHGPTETSRTKSKVLVIVCSADSIAVHRSVSSGLK